jgi:hypothetical protein
VANVVRQWKKFVAISCSHGHLIDPVAAKSVLKFIELYRPHTRIHLGDYVDTAAFRSGAIGTEDEAISLDSDVCKGAAFLKEYQPDVLLNGNHDWRLWKNAEHWQQIRAEAARSLISKIRAAIPRKCVFIESYDIRHSWYTLGDTKFLHGWFFNENAIRDHAEHFGRCVIGHVHKVGQSAGRRFDSPTAYCVGMLGDPVLFQYAAQRRATSQWSQGFAWGEYSESKCMVNLSMRDGPEWRLPF